MAYAELEPFGSTAMAWQMAVIAATVANGNRDPKKHPLPYQPRDFMPPEPVIPEEKAVALRTRFDAAMMAFGGRVRKPGEARVPKGRRYPGRDVPPTESPPDRGPTERATTRPKRRRR